MLRKTGTDILPIPKDGEIFELTLNAVDFNLVQMVRDEGYSKPKKWKFKGPKIIGTQTKKFKLVRVKNRPDVETVNRKLVAHNNLALGEWSEAFRTKYPYPAGREKPVGFTGSRWENPEGDRGFPFLFDDGDSWYLSFIWFDEKLESDYRIAVEVPD